MKKRGLIIIACMSVMLCLSACGNKKENETTTKNAGSVNETQVQTQQPDTETESVTDTETESESEQDTDEVTEKSTNEPLEADAYDGTYSDERDSNTVIEVTTKDEVTTVKISMAVSVTQSVEWIFSGKFDENGTLKYKDGIKNTVNYTDETTSTAIEEYKDGTGSVTVADGILTWDDEKEGTSPEGAYKKL